MLSEHVLKDVRVLQSDDRLREVLIGFTRQLVRQVGKVVVEDVDFKHQLAMCKALYIARIMHGLTSPLIIANAWKETHIWGSYREIPFDQLIRRVMAILKE